MNKVNAFILAAGQGERLRPVTNHIPKPLVPILGSPALQRVIERISELAVDKIGVNLHYQKDLIKEWIEGSSFSDKVTIFPEEDALGTGGALKNAEELLGSGPFILHNSDIMSNIDLSALLKFHLASDNLVTLAVHDHAEFNSVAVDKEGLLKMVGRSDKPETDDLRWLAYTGVSIYSPDFLRFLPQGASGLVSGWLKAVDEGRKIGTFDVSGSFWSDIGTPESYISTLSSMLKADGEMIYIHPSSQGGGNVDMRGFVVAEDGSYFGTDVFLKDTVLLQGGRAEDGSSYDGNILGEGFNLDLNIYGQPDSRTLIGTGGSDRNYYRIKSNGDSAVLMECSEDDLDFERHIDYSRFFLKHAIPVPELLEVIAEEKEAVFEDLGDTSLYNWLKFNRDKEYIEGIYKKVLELLVSFHTNATEHISECPLLESRVFDNIHFRWETEYFLDRFISGIRKIEVNDHSALDKELDALAQKADSFSKTVMHRDFQSQNIIITKGGIPRIIDFQGARMGPPAYDVASILWDPYYMLDDELRDVLLEHYLDKMKDAGSSFDKDSFIISLPYCRIQRHMQALGAYGFLSSEKGKGYFLNYVPEGVRLLKEDIEFLKGELPELYRLINGL